MEPIYIRTDRNGTKYFYDWTCPRCGGAGFADKWKRTGGYCYECGGSGKRFNAKIIKEYTPEYQAKLDAKRIAKAKKEEEEKAKYAEEHAEEIAEKQAEENRRITEFRYKENGCGPDGVGYVLRGNTYKKKDEIKKAGGKGSTGHGFARLK